MQVFRSLAEARGRFGPCAVTIGNFDGMHIGHQELFREVALLAEVHKWTPAALTFDPHPACIVAPDRAPKRLTGFDERVEMMQRCGIRQVLILPFSPEIAAIEPEAFVRELMVRDLRTRAIVVGDNFRFGHKHTGDIHLLADLGRSLNFSTHIEPAVRWRGRIVSSTAVRQSISSGQVGLACRLLGRPFALRGTVVAGHGVGARQTVPTLNLRTDCEVLPLDGVYVTRVRDLEDGRRWNSITNIGMRPTFDGTERTIESFLLESYDGRPPVQMAVEFLRRIREERKFETPEALKQQILRDVGRAQTYHRRLLALQTAA